LRDPSGDLVLLAEIRDTRGQHSSNAASMTDHPLFLDLCTPFIMIIF